MSVSYFKKALASLKEYKGMIGIMGGEPTLHPMFKEIVSLLPNLGTPDYKPIRDFSGYRTARLSRINHRVGLWTSLGDKYYEHFEAIQDTFPYQCINDHSHKGEHITLLASYKELGFTGDEFRRYRDDCWVQREWSASITPKGAFFCEVAGALDMLYDGAGGWDLDSDWWKKQPDEFGEQLKWCEVCSACLPVPKVEARLGVDLVTQAHADKLKALGSKKKIEILTGYDKTKYTANKSCEPYLPKEGNTARIASTNESLKPRRIDAFIVCENYSDYLDEALKFNTLILDSINVVSSKTDLLTEAVCKKHGVNFIVSERIHQGKAPFAKGKAINDALEMVKPTDWVLIMDADVILSPTSIRHLTLNPGALYFTRRWGPEKLQDVPIFLRELRTCYSVCDVDALKAKYASKREAKVEGRIGNDVEHLPFGYFQLFNMKASALKGLTKVYPEVSDTAELDDKIFGFEVYPKHKIVSLPVPEFDVIHLPHGMFKENWAGRVSPTISEIREGKISMSNTFVCIDKCQYQGRVYKVGEQLTTESIDVPFKRFRRV